MDTESVTNEGAPFKTGILVRRRSLDQGFMGAGRVGRVLSTTLTEGQGGPMIAVDWGTGHVWLSFIHTLEVLPTPEGILWLLSK